MKGLLNELSEFAKFMGSRLKLLDNKVAAAAPKVVRIDASYMDLTNGYPYAVKEIPYPKGVKGTPVVAIVVQHKTIATTINAPFVNVYARTATGFKVRCNIGAANWDKYEIYAVITNQE